MPGPLPEDGLGARKARSKQATAMELRSAILAWLIFVVTLLLFAFAYEEYAGFVWVLATFSTMLSILFILLGFSSRHPEHVLTGALCLVSVVLGILVGLAVNSSYMKEFWRLSNGAKFTNVSPTEPGLSHGDATELEFATGTFVDGGRTLGMMADGEVWCVAPVASKFLSPVVQYWAVGTNCCQERIGFSCDDATDITARSGIVLDKNSKEVENYRDAITQAEAVYNIKSDNGALLVRWIKDSESVTSDLWSGALVCVSVAITLHLIFALAVSLLGGRKMRGLSTKFG